MMTAVPAKGVTPDAAANALKDELARIAREGVGDAELRRVLTQWTASEIYKLDSVFNQARELGQYWINDMPINSSAVLLQRLREVTPDQVQSVARRHFSADRLTTGVLVPDPGRRNGNARKPAAVQPSRH